MPDPTPAGQVDPRVIPAPPMDPEAGFDLSLIEENLKLTPWERILANDDAINFIDEARAALKEQHATTTATTGEADHG